ncbi:hypothetical protein AMJ57_01025 [Parcubacteria bacterium SG8_24]|nr:MAG: hypothetical protein AMJ57_01025 [Parcubacteria bacterium SG8_24]
MTRDEKPPVGKTRIATGIIAIVLGSAFFVYAGIDDSPGGQVIGVTTVFFGIYGLVRSRKRDRSSRSE